MTRVRGIERQVTSGAPDGFRVVTSLPDGVGQDRALEFRRSILPSTIRRGTVAQIETYINSEMAAALSGETTQCRAKVYSANPLDVDVVCSDRPIPDSAFDKTEL